MESFLELVRDGKVELEKLISHRFKIDNGLNAYEVLLGKKKAYYLGILIDYQKKNMLKKTITVNKKSLSVKQKHIHLGVIGAGQFAQGYSCQK